MPEPTLQDVLDAIQGLSTHTDEQFAQVRFEFRSEMHSEMNNMEHRLRSDMNNMEQRLMTEVDRFVVAHQTLDVELVALRSRCYRMESFMGRVAQKLDLSFEVT